MTKTIEHIRRKYYAQTTIGEVYIDNKLFCYTLEDTVRPRNIKVKGLTAIPSDNYFVTLRYSPSFERDIVMLYNDSTKTKVKNEFISFSWIYAHGGNRHKDTMGCICVGYTVNKNTIHSTAEKELYDIIRKWIEDRHEVVWTITNDTQTT